MKKAVLKVFFFLSLFNVFLARAQNYSLNDVEAVLVKSGNNRAELEKAVTHFKQKGDSLQLKAVYFLIANMDIHGAESYYWADSLERRVEFDELAYKNMEASVEAFEALKSIHGKLHPVAVKYRDIDSMKADFLINNIEQAFTSWKSSKVNNISFEDFCEYILPYRISIEPLQKWREVYSERYLWLKNFIKTDSLFSSCNALKRDVRGWFTNTYYISTRSEPLPRLGALQLLHRRMGPCEDMAGLSVFSLRSLGIPASEDISVFWGTSFGSHTWNVAFKEGMQPMHFDVSNSEMSEYQLVREPSKVIRLTYSKQAETIAAQYAVSQIPKGFLQNQNYKDVTSEYWPVYNINSTINPKLTHSDLAFACVFNHGKWRASWWGKIKGNSVEFEKMPSGVVFLPMDYSNDKLIPAGYPVALSKEGESQELIPDIKNLRSIIMKEQEKYLIFRPGKKYALYYWNNNWIKLEEKTATNTTRELIFEKAPRNTLFLLVPEYSQSKERPFTINESGERQWW